ncbi:MAG TPA: branched-chain amino acid transaminase [Aggregatilinea sp.]|jgi:branched-chain amino acid aminotransferase|uniref:branched-chain amino acid transaminase n=1 Tax=Aggregatilinea sp. TaxID=2806333 RepID=UPI002BB6DF84|nr:branched-chain amino acid transaminase [Aggregatilinea sp.]HML22615.1 branched-chain amino acid transaminase [Aggregatilinea sp.]
MAAGPNYAFFKGKIVPIDEAKVSVMTHALNYGTGAFGGVRAYWNAEDEDLYIFRPLDHFRRVLNSARLLMMDLPYTPESMLDILLQLLRKEGFREDVYIRPLVYKSSNVIGVRLHNLEAEFTMFAQPFGSYIEDEEGSKVTFSAWRRVDDNAIPARGKISGAYANSAFIKTDAMLNGFDEALVLNENGHISEGSAENFFMVRDGVAITPPINANILEGITRRTVLQLLAEEMKMPVVEREIDRTEVYLADEAFFCGTGVQVVAIAEVDHRPIGTGKMGPVVQQLRSLYFDLVRGKLSQHRDWNVPVYCTKG